MNNFKEQVIKYNRKHKRTNKPALHGAFVLALASTALLFEGALFECVRTLILWSPFSSLFGLSYSVVSAGALLLVATIFVYTLKRPPQHSSAQFAAPIKL